MDHIVPETPESRAEEEPGRTRRSLDDVGGVYRQASEDEIDDNFFADHFLPPLDHSIKDDNHHDDALLFVSDEKDKIRIVEENPTPPETPDVSDASTSSNSIQASRNIPQHHHHIKFAYNPYTSYSPNTPRRSYRETLTSSSHSSTKAPPRRLDSEAKLEQASREIRQDLLQREMLELAAHAEQAAEAGEEYFSAQPCVFSDDIMPKPSSLVRRSFSEGGMEQRRSSPRRRTITLAKELRLPSSSSYFTKLPVVELRDINEVFPPFQSFHTNLRTHMYRNNVSQLIYTEERARAPILVCRSAESTNEKRKHAFQHFRFGRWRRPHKSVGELVSGHLATDMPSPRPKVSVPPGLDEDADVRASLFKQTSTQNIEDSRPTVALIDSESYDDQSVDRSCTEDPVTLSTPLTDGFQLKSNSMLEESCLESNSPDFVTPMRLRSIRRLRPSTSDNHLFESLMLPTNSISEDSPMRTKQPGRDLSLETVLDVSDSLADSRDQSNIILPEYNTESTRALTARPVASRPKLKRRSLDLDDLPSMSPSPIQDCGAKLSDPDFQASSNSLVDALDSNKQRQRNQFSEVTSDPGVVQKSATVEEPAYWSNQRRRNILRSAFGGVPHDSSFKSDSKGNRALYVRPAENDDFLNNFLYCGKSEKVETETAAIEGCEPCGEPNAGYCCTSLFNETLGVNLLFPLLAPSKASNLVRLGPYPQCSKEHENWFGMANDRIDAAFDSIIGNVDPTAQRYSGSFRAPTLRKRNEELNDWVELSEDESDDDKKFEDISRYDLDDASFGGPMSDDAP